MRSLVKIKPSRNGKITLSFIDKRKFCLSREFFHITNMNLNAISVNKIIAKISEITVNRMLELDHGKSTCIIIY